MGVITYSTCSVTLKPTTAWLFHLSFAYPPPRLGDFEIGSRGDVRVACGVAVGNAITGLGVSGAARRAAASMGLLGVDGGGADAGRNPGRACGASLSEDEVIMTLGAALVDSASLAGRMGVDCGAWEASNILSSV
jgi:hypothetical protein